MGACISSALGIGKKKKAATTKKKKPPPEAAALAPTVNGRWRTVGLKGLLSHRSSSKTGKEAPLGKRTDFGYSRDFKLKYRQGKLLGHGQFGRTYVANRFDTDEKVAVKVIEKKKFGCTYVANCFNTDEKVAIKVIEKKKMLRPIAVEDVKREVKIMKALSGDENIVQFHEAFEDEDYVYIVMELCEGGELLDRILAKKNSQYSEKDAAKIVRQMLKVAACCHLRGIVHRDLKPENFLFKSQSEDSILQATDFGLSDFIRPGKKFHDVVGSAYYVAPEVLKKKSGPESDVWSIGVITYILLSGRRPFWDKTGEGVFKEVLRKVPNFHDKTWQAISSSAKDFVQKLLCKDPKARLTAAQALSHAWVRDGGEAPDVPLDISILSNMRDFVTYSRLKRIAFRALASTLDPEEITNLRDQFNVIDTDKNGTITLEEMRQALAKDRPWKLKDDKVLNILRAMDDNEDGLVDFEEFVAATLHVYQLENNTDKWHKCTQAAFEKVDVDNDGYITADELRTYTGIKGSIETILDEGDIDKDGRLSLVEFRKLLRRASFGSQNRERASAR